MLKLISICLLITASFISNTQSADCTTPFDCYMKAIEMLKQDRLEMRTQVDNYQSLYKESLTKMDQMRKDFETKVTQLEDLNKSMIGKMDEMKKEFDSKLIDVKNYSDRPFTMVNTHLYGAVTLSTNLSVISLNDKIPANSKKILVLASYFSGGSHGETHGFINLSTKINGNVNGRSLGISTYPQNAYDTNSSVFEFDLDGTDFNLYFASTVNVGNISLNINLLGYK